MSLKSCINHPCTQLCIKITRWLPVLFIVVIVCWSYYAYVVELCIFTVVSVPEKVLYLIPYHIILFLFLWSYWQTTFAQILEPPKQFLIPANFVEQLQQSTPNNQRELLERLAKDLPVITRSFDGSVRYCEKCSVIKPDRSHHCAVCGVCVLKMDHHCPWVNTCVHYNNYKFFILFLGYALLFCLFVFLTDLQYFVKFWTEQYAKQGGGKFHIMFLFFVSGMFGISVSSLFFYHLWLTGKNRSTLEAFRPPVFYQSGPDKNGFNLGCLKNFRQVFGPCNPFAFFPFFTSLGDGAVFPTNPSLITQPPTEGRAPTANNVPENFVRVNDGYELNGVISSPGLKTTNSANVENAGDGLRYPSRIFSLDEEQLLNRHRWTDETDDSASDYENNRPNGFLKESAFGEV